MPKKFLFWLNAKILRWKLWIWNSWLLGVVARMLYISVLLVGRVCQPNDLVHSKWWLLAFLLDPIVSSGVELIMTMGKALQLGEPVSGADLARGPYMCLPNLKIMISRWKVLSEILYFIRKSWSLLIFYKKASFFQKNRLFSVHLSFYPLKAFWIIQRFCMNQCRCSLSAERSCYIELLSVIICATKIRNLKPDLRKQKLFCLFSIWHLIKLCQILHR